MKIESSIEDVLHYMDKFDIQRMKEALKKREDYFKSLAKEHPLKENESRSSYAERLSSQTGRSIELMEIVFDYTKEDLK